MQRVTDRGVLTKAQLMGATSALQDASGCVGWELPACPFHTMAAASATTRALCAIHTTTLSLLHPSMGSSATTNKYALTACALRASSCPCLLVQKQATLHHNISSTVTDQNSPPSVTPAVQSRMTVTGQDISPAGQQQGWQGCQDVLCSTQQASGVP